MKLPSMNAGMSAARAGYLAGMTSTSNVLAGDRLGIPLSGTMAHAFIGALGDEEAAFRAFARAFPDGTTLLIDTYDTLEGARKAIAVGQALRAAGHRLRSVRIDSGDYVALSKEVRRMLDAAGLTDVGIFISGGLDEYAIAALAAEPVDIYGAGTAVVVGSGAPTANLVYKLVEVDGRPVVKRSEHKATVGGRKTAIRRHKPTGTAVEEVVVSQGVPEWQVGDRMLQRDFVTGGEPVDGIPTLGQSRERLHDALISIPWEGLKLSAGDPAIPVTIVPAS